MPTATPPTVPIWLRGRYRTLVRGPTAAIVRRDFEEIFRRLGLLDAALRPRALAELQAEAAPLRTPGRGATPAFSAGPLGEAILRPYRRGGWMRHVNARRYFLGDRAFHELVLTERLRRAGVPAPEVLAGVQTSRRPGYVAALVTRRVRGARPASSLLRGLAPPEAGPILDRIGRSVARLHRVGGWHADLNAHNILVPRDPAGAPVLIDFDRGRLLPAPLPDLLARRNLGRLRRSLRKLDLGGALAAWPALESAYRAAG